MALLFALVLPSLSDKASSGSPGPNFKYLANKFVIFEILEENIRDFKLTFRKREIP